MTSDLTWGQVTMDERHARTDDERKEAELIQRLEAQGLVEKLAAPPAPPDFQPLQMPGPGLSETILAERRRVPTYFLDSSAIAKRYVAEAGSAWIISLTDATSRNVCWLAAVTRVEVVAGLSKQRIAGGRLAPKDRHAILAD